MIAALMLLLAMQGGPGSGWAQRCGDPKTTRGGRAPRVEHLLVSRRSANAFGYVSFDDLPADQVEAFVRLATTAVDECISLAEAERQPPPAAPGARDAAPPG